MGKVIAAIVGILLIAGVVMYDLGKTNDILYGNGHKCGGYWQVSERNASWWYCNNCGTWRQIK